MRNKFVTKIKGHYEWRSVYFMLKAIIIDNEKPAIDILTILLEKTNQVEVIGSFLSAKEALLNFPDLNPDVAFLDIEMPEVTGLELAENLSAINSDMDIIFVTAYEQYALQAFRVNALDYLLKPLSYEDVEHTVARLLKRRKTLLDSNKELSYPGHISCFGKFSVYGSDKRIVKWRTSKAQELFAFMLEHLNLEVSKWKICESLWPDCDMDKVTIYLHTTIYKMKKVLTAANITFDFTYTNSCYKLILPNISIDTKEFNSIPSNQTITSGNLKQYEYLFSIYKGNYMEDNDYMWSSSKKEEYLNKYRNLATCLTEYYMEQSEYSDAERILRTVLSKSFMDDFFNEMLLKLYLIKKDRVAFLTHYNLITEWYKKELELMPSETMQALHKDMMELAI